MSDPAAARPALPGPAQRRSVLGLRDIARTYEQGAQKLDVFKGANGEVAAGEIVALVGPSGSGKSSLLHICGLLEPPSAGEVIIAGRAGSALNDAERTAIRRDDIGFVYQFHHLLPEFNALENLIVPQMIAGRSSKDAEAHGRKLLSLVGLSERATHRPARLSGGEQQRVAIARALCNRPKLLLADEPTGNLDPKTASQVFLLLTEICRAHAVGALIATHNLQLTTKMDRTWLLHEGRLVDAGKIQV
jgi:lipoprotein-releasing system ATP-binding protein